MEKCKRKKKISMKDMGVIAIVKCNKPVFQNELCKYHFKKQQEKTKPWGERDTYQNAEQWHLDKLVSLKLKTETKNRLFRCHNGIIEEQIKHKFYKTNIPADPSLFCIKKL